MVWIIIQHYCCTLCYVFLMSLQQFFFLLLHNSLWLFYLLCPSVPSLLSPLPPSSLPPSIRCPPNSDSKLKEVNKHQLPPQGRGGGTSKVLRIASLVVQGMAGRKPHQQPSLRVDYKVKNHYTLITFSYMFWLWMLCDTVSMASRRLRKFEHFWDIIIYYYTLCNWSMKGCIVYKCASLYTLGNEP